MIGINNKSIGNLIFALLILTVIVSIIRAQKFTTDYQVTSGLVTTISSSGYQGAGNYSVHYEYAVGNKIYTGSQNYNYCSNVLRGHILDTLLIGKHFPVAYASTDISQSTMLLTRDNAERFKYDLPDSIKSYDAILSCKLTQP